VPRSCDGRKDVAKLLVYVDVLAQACKIRGRVERGGERGCRVHENLHAHGLRDDKDVAEDDGGVEQTRIPPDRLEGNLAREGWRAADLKKLMLCANCAELCRDEMNVCLSKLQGVVLSHAWKVASRLAHHPDRRTFSFFAWEMI
jgi:hypothetical protein